VPPGTPEGEKHMKLRQLQKLLALLFSFALIAAACGGSEDGDTDTDTNEETSEESTATTAPDTEVEEVEVGEEGRTYGGSISVGLEAEATGLRPWEDSCASPCYNIIRTIHDTLFEIDTNFVPQPFLAESSSVNADFTEYVVTLRPGVTFHNGVELNAQTIVDMFAIQETGATSAGAIGQASLASVAATGDLEVTYTLSQGNSAFLAFLTRAPIGAVFEPGAAADSEAYSIAPVGTGPFMIESRDLDNETVVVKNDSYWLTDPEGNPLPYLDSIAFRPIPDETTRLDSLLSGTVDAFQTLRQGTIRDALDQDGIELIQFQGNNTGGGHFNTAVPPFDDVRVRKGLIHLNPQDRVIEALGGTGISLPATQWFSPDSPWYSEKVADAWPKFDFEAGVALLQEYVNDPERSDGKPVGEKIDAELSCPPDPTLIASLQVVEEVWTGSELVNVTLTNFDQQTHINNALGAPPDFTGTHQAHCWRWSSDDDPSLSINAEVTPPNAAVAEAFGVPGVVSPTNFSNWANQDAFEAALAATKTDDFDERYALYESIMMLIAEEVPLWYSGHTATAFGVTPGVTGLNGWHLPSGELGAGIPAVEGRYHEVSLEPAV